MASIYKTCIDCGQQFEFSPSEQTFYRAKNLVDPKRCYNCRQMIKRNPGHARGNECFECNEKYVRGVLTDATRHCLACGRLIPENGPQYAVIRSHAQPS